MRLAELMRKRDSGPVRPPLERLFTLTGVRTRLEQRKLLVPRGAAGVILQPLPQAEFVEIVSRAEAAVQAAFSGRETALERSDDPYKFRWLVLRNSDFDQLLEGVHEISAALDLSAWWRKLLCAVFAFKDDLDRPVYWVYNYQWGAFYPIAPAAGNHHRDVERERLLSALLEAEVAAPPELGVWFPLWGIPI